MKWFVLLIILASMGILLWTQQGMSPKECHIARTYADSAVELRETMEQCG